MTRRVAWLIVLVACSGVPAGAQTRLYALFSGTYPCSALGCPAGTFIDIDAASGRVIGTAPVSPGWHGSTPGVTPDGRYLVFNGYRSPGAHLDAIDTASYVIASFPVTVTVPVFGYATHPAVSMAYFQRPDDEQVFIVDAHGTREFQGLPARPGLLRGLTTNGSRLVFHRPRTNDTAVADSITGQILGVVPETYGVVEANADGSEIYAFGQAISRPLERRAVASGAVLASAAVTLAGNSTFARDPRTGHIWLTSAGSVRVLDGATLSVIGERSFGFGRANAAVAFDPDRPIAYLGWKATSEDDGLPAHFVALDTGTMDVEGEADISMPGLGLIFGLVLAPRPPRVDALSAAVSESTVTLSWTQASQPLATHLIVEAGSASGLTNLARFVVPAGATSLAVPGVPAGTYFVRVRSANATGEGAASNEIAITVP